MNRSRPDRQCRQRAALALPPGAPICRAIAAVRAFVRLSRDEERCMPAVETIEVETGKNPTGSVIWMHGLGADGHDFEPIVPELVRPQERALRFVFPNAPVQPVTINGGYAMRAWYDIVGFDRHAAQDERGIRASDAVVRELVGREVGRGTPAHRIALAGFSQGGAMALFTGMRHPHRLAGVMALSCYMLLAPTLATERSSASLETPIFLAHGTQDAIVPALLGEETRRLLEGLDYRVEWHVYPMAHAVCAEEVVHIGDWLRRVLP
jgi:phospholipase/carboxylesterase